MAYVRKISSTETSIYVDISGLSNPQNTYDSFRVRINSGSWKYISVDPDYTGSDSGNYNFTGLLCGTSYTIDGEAEYGGTWYTVTSLNTSTDPCTRPSNFEWTYPKISGQDFKLTDDEWNAFLNRINDFRDYKGLSLYSFYDYYHGDYSFTKAYSGNDFYAYMFNQARNAIIEMSPPISPPSSKSSGQDIYASYLNGLRDSLNSIE